jgi:acyl-CoA synthetase (AMP-forming)/AMP-acid ligase II
MSTRSLADFSRERAAATPHEVAYTFLRDDGCAIDTQLTYWDLHTRALSLAALIGQNTVQRDRVMLVLGTGRDFVAGFVACQYAHVIAVPLLPPTSRTSVDRLLAIFKDSQPVVALSSRNIIDRIREMSGAALEWPLHWIAVEDAPMLCDLPGPQLQMSKSDIVFIQYTSGSTGAPKGVMVTHDNLYSNHLAIEASFSHPRDKPTVGWLPLHHDMGLIGQIVEPLYLGIHSILLPPVAFVQKPFRWLDAVSRYRASTSGGPNFAYELCTQRIQEEQLEQLDLSCWELAFCGSEPVSADTFERFVSKFVRCGFRRSAFYPCYGLAEATLFVTGGRKGTDPKICTIDDNQDAAANGAGERTTRRVVSCGRTWTDYELRIVDPVTCDQCAESEVGEIWVSSKSIAQGYWNNPDLSSAIFGARIRGVTRDFLRTGDLGYIKDGELFVTGRLKDLIIIRGRNHYPQDIERTIEKANVALRSSGGAAFAISDGVEERLIIVQEVERRYVRRIRFEDAIRDIQQAIVRHHEVVAHDVVLVWPGEVPKTSSGKVRRGDCKSDYLQGKLRVLGSSRSAQLQPRRSDDGQTTVEPLNSIDRRERLSVTQS